MKRKKMYRKKIVFGAGVCTIFILCSLSSALSIISNIDPLIADAGGPYEAFVDNPIIQFKGSATGGILPYTFNWTFPDGTFSNEQNPIKEFPPVEENYIVFLTVTDSAGNTDNDSANVTIRKRRCDLYVTIKLNSDKIIYKEQEDILFDVLVSSKNLVRMPDGSLKTSDCCKYSIKANISEFIGSSNSEWIILHEKNQEICPDGGQTFRPFWENSRKGVYIATAIVNCPWDVDTDDNHDDCVFVVLTLAGIKIVLQFEDYLQNNPS